MANIFYSFALLLAIITKGSALNCYCTQNNNVLNYCGSDNTCDISSCNFGYQPVCATVNGYYYNQYVAERGCYCAPNTWDNTCYTDAISGLNGNVCICDYYRCTPSTTSTTTTVPGKFQCQCTNNNLFLSPTSCSSKTCSPGSCSSSEEPACVSLDLTTDGDSIHEKGCGCKSLTEDRCIDYYIGNRNVDAKKCYCTDANCNYKYNGANANRSVYAVMMLAFAWCMLTMA